MLNFTTGSGSFFRLQGRVAKLLNDVNAHRGATVGAGVLNLRRELDASTVIELVEGLYAAENAHRAACSGLPTYLRSLAQRVTLAAVDDDVVLTSRDLRTAMTEVVRQMTEQGYYVAASTVSVSVTAAAGNYGDAAVVATAVGPAGYTHQSAFAENLDLVVTGDSQSGATEGRETLSYRGDLAQGDALQWDWPKGSAASGSLSAVDAAQDAGNNLLTNSAFEDFTADVPDQWEIATGTAGGTVFAAGSGQAYLGDDALRFLGNGSQLTAVTQAFADATDGTAGTLRPLTVYAVHCVLKVSAVPSQGVLALELVNGSTSAVLAQATGAANAVTKDLTAATTSYASLSGFFRTPAVLPDEVLFRVRLSTALENGRSVYVDHLALTAATRLYAGGVYAACFSKASKLIVGDRYEIAVANTRTTTDWQLVFERLFGMRQLGLQLPTSGAFAVSTGFIA